MHIGQIGISEFICVPCPITWLIVWVHFGYTWDTFIRWMDRHFLVHLYSLSHGTQLIVRETRTLTLILWLCVTVLIVWDTLSPSSDGAWLDWQDAPLKTEGIFADSCFSRWTKYFRNIYLEDRHLTFNNGINLFIFWGVLKLWFMFPSVVRSLSVADTERKHKQKGKSCATATSSDWRNCERPW